MIWPKTQVVLLNTLDSGVPYLPDHPDRAQFGSLFAIGEPGRMRGGPRDHEITAALQLLESAYGWRLVTAISPTLWVFRRWYWFRELRNLDPRRLVFRGKVPGGD